LLAVSVDLHYNAAINIFVPTVLCPQNPLGECPPDPLFGFKGPTSKGREGTERKVGMVGEERKKGIYYAVLKILRTSPAKGQAFNTIERLQFTITYTPGVPFHTPSHTHNLYGIDRQSVTETFSGK